MTDIIDFEQDTRRGQRNIAELRRRSAAPDAPTRALLIVAEADDTFLRRLPRKLGLPTVWLESADGRATGGAIDRAVDDLLQQSEPSDVMIVVSTRATAVSHAVDAETTTAAEATPVPTRSGIGRAAALVDAAKRIAAQSHDALVARPPVTRRIRDRGLRVHALVHVAENGALLGYDNERRAFAPIQTHAM